MGRRHGDNLGTGAAELAVSPWSLAGRPDAIGAGGARARPCHGAVFRLRRTDRTVGAGYAGLTFSLPIASGLRFRAGSFAIDRKTLRYSHRLGTGDLCVTNERLIFRSPERAVTPIASQASISSPEK